MFHSAANPLLRVALFPVLLLFWQQVFGTDLPLLAPAMCAVFLTTTHQPPPFIMVVLMASVLSVTAWLQVLIDNIFADYPHLYYLTLFAVFYWCMERTKKNPQDVFAILLIVSTAMIATFSRQQGMSVSDIPSALWSNIWVGGMVAYLAYGLFPSGTPLAPQKVMPSSNTQYLLDWQIFVKALVLLMVLVVCMNFELEQTTIITVVVGLIIKDIDPIVGNDYGARRYLATFASVLYAIPTLIACILQMNLIGTLGITLVSAMLMGIQAQKKHASFNSIQLMYTSFVVLIFYPVTATSISAIADNIERFASVLLAVVIGWLTLIVLSSRKRVNKQRITIE
ncbi:DUF2955 domain-containing protein [Thalassotalea ponticola]|uniref:DUF2955 domain-containing protein n=1 Tax=Thalassotalea ponticola TaxID=1523392 RepID=UPI0025B37AB8|nr:DUF2955 domain-containing protein [Thalassotalea ponticola]MDN3651323.1 DUF2955 domain-containing protein [Thalassotalea ponticola]